MACVGCPIAPFHTVADACAEYALAEGRFRAALARGQRRPAQHHQPVRRVTTMCRRVLATMPSRSQAASSRLTVCSVVPVISAMSPRVTGKAISIPSGTLRPDWLARRSSAPGHPLLDRLRRELGHPLVELAEPRADGAVGLGGEAVVLRGEAPARAAPASDSASVSVAQTAVAG